MFYKTLHLLPLILLVACTTQLTPPMSESTMTHADRIQPYTQNPFY